MKRSSALTVLLALMVLSLNLPAYSQIQASCFSPGNTVVTDPNESLTYQFDIEKVSLAEPIYGDGGDRLVTTLKVQGLAPLPLGSWNVFIKGADNVQRFVQMSNFLGTPQYRYGTVTFLLGLPLFNYQGNVQGTFSGDGTISFVIEREKLGNPATGSDLTVSARTYIRPLIDLVQIDQTSEGFYTLLGSGNCTPFQFATWGQLGDIPLTGDYNRNGRADFTVWRPDNNTFYSSDSATGAFESFEWGNANLDDIPVAGDFDTDSRSDWVVFRPSTGTWHIYQRADNTARTAHFGQSEDVPVSGDFDGDRINDVAVWRPSAGAWFILSSSNDAFTGVQFGSPEDVPVPADYDGDGKTDIAVFRPSTGSWYVLRSGDGGFQAAQFGLGTDRAVPADYDGDGKTDYAVWRPSTGAWYVLRSGDGGFYGYQWGLGTDKAVPADYNGNGRTDFAVWRPENGVWYVSYN